MTVTAMMLLVGCGPTIPPTAPGSTRSSPATSAQTSSASALTVGGLSLHVSPPWQVRQSAVIGTGLQRKASCGSAEVIDGPPPSEGGSASLSRAALQLCVVERDDDLTLSQWLSGRGHSVATPARYGTCDVLLLPGATDRQLAYAQLPHLRVEIATSVTTTSALEARRRGELAQLLSQLACPSTA